MDADPPAQGVKIARLNTHDGSRVYLEYDFDAAEDEEEIELRPMGSERYPTLEGGGIEWREDVGELNRLLMS